MAMSHDHPAGRHAVVLAAGAGSRMSDVEPVKPLAEVQGQPLLLHVLASLAAAGATGASVVTGHRAAEIEAVLPRSPIPAEAVRNPDWASAPNGVSVLAAADSIRPGSFLCMSDHLIDPLLATRLVAEARAPLSLAVDRRLGHPWVDEADVTRVRTAGRAIRAIGKRLCVYDAYDTGLFLIGPELVEALRQQKSPSLSDGVAVLARLGLAEAIDIGDAPWLDVDDARALELARRKWRI
ncbi:nucleotidyltransferase [Sandaracinobacter neustonicus]|uniref:Nucleotidyltransferase n=2 Tax=Sandaracinobacter neustonicus TaxID=1715348 RepID=A0A501XL73_9SPHN|nr:nucleotidyltransferase [Sandaracinobacter neustonicus]